MSDNPVFVVFGDGTWARAIKVDDIKEDNEIKKRIQFQMEDDLVFKFGDKALKDFVNDKGWLENTYRKEMVHQLSDEPRPSLFIQCNFLGKWAPGIEIENNLLVEIERLKEQRKVLIINNEDMKVAYESLMEQEFKSEIMGTLNSLRGMIEALLSKSSKGGE